MQIKKRKAKRINFHGSGSLIQRKQSTKEKVTFFQAEKTLETAPKKDARIALKVQY